MTISYTESSKDGFYYFDIETVPLQHYMNEKKRGIDPTMSKIISIQYQHLSPSTGRALAKLEILKEWEPQSSERIIIEQFKKMFIDGRNKWYFIPIGNNLDFEFRFMKCKLEQYYGCQTALEFLEDKMKVDLKDFLVMLNNCTFSNYSELIGKSHEAKDMAQWYALKDYDRIEEYIRKEADDFVNFYSNAIAEMPKLRRILKFCNSNGSYRTNNGPNLMIN